MEITGLPKIPILLVTADPEKAAALGAVLREPDAEIVRSDGVNDALKAIRDRAFALVILDPDSVGEECFSIARRLREDPRSRSEVILFLSNGATKESDRDRGFQIGVVDFLSLPLDDRSLLDTARMAARIFAGSEAARAADADAGGAAASAAAGKGRLPPKPDAGALRIERQMRYLEGMSEISKVLEQNLEMEKVLQMAVEKSLELFHGDCAFLIHPLDPSQSHFRIKHIAETRSGGSVSVGETWMAKAFHPDFAADLLASQEPIVLTPTAPIPGITGRCEEGEEGRLAAVAMRPKNGLPWALGIHQCGSGTEWNEEELRLLKDIAQRLTGVLDNLILHRDLQISERRIRWLVENTSEIIWRMNMRHPIPTVLSEEEQLDAFYREAYLAECNDAMARRYGFRIASDILGSGLQALLPREVPGSLLLLRRFIREKYRYLDSEAMTRDDSGGIRYMLANLVGILEGDCLIGAWGTSRDVTESRIAQEEVKRSRDQLDVILQGIADVIMVFGPPGELLYFNEAAARMLGLSAPGVDVKRFVGAPMEEVLGRIEIRDEDGNPIDPAKTPIRVALEGLEVAPTMLRYRIAGQGPERWLITKVKPILDEAGKVRMAISISQDTTELRKAEEQFRQAQKMEAIGRLAGGVAHDFNNLLTAINGYSDLLQGMTDDGDPRKPYLEEIRKAGERAASLTNQLLVYSRRQIVAPRIVDVNSVVVHMEKMLRRLIGEDIDLDVRLKPDLRSVRADPGQLEQVILNLAVNARDAMPLGGRIDLSTGDVSVGDGFMVNNEPVHPGHYIVLAVADSGTGMDEAVKNRIFEPFFTTKKMGRGTGLGLATVYGIVKQSGGHIGVESEKGRGTAFRILFPSVPPTIRERSHGKGKIRLQGSGAVDLSGSETILLAEDDNAVRGLVKDILTAQGYRVLDAGNGSEALELARRFEGAIDLLLTDVVMAQMGGRELTDKVKELRPELKTIYMSGYTDDAVIRHGVFAKTEPFLQKPFSPENLARKVREVLDMVPAAMKKPSEGGPA
jgi:PAS domain S-box-containing protein